MDWYLYVAMPVIAALIGYVTKRVAIEMMFRPVEFVGIRPVFGWQAVVARSAPRMIRVSTELLTTKLVDPKEIFARLDADRIVQEIERPLLIAVDEITRDVLEQYEPRLWELLPVLAQDLIVKQVQAGAPALVRELVDELKENLDEVLDLRYLAAHALGSDRALVVRLVREISRPEMAFIARCGIYFGFALGLVQTLVFALTHSPIVLPLFGALIGWFTDWLAIKLVFFPRTPKRIVGRWTLQGVFQRRRDQVARDYGALIARDVLTVSNLLDGILRGPGSDRLVAMVERTVARAVDEQTKLGRPFVSVALGEPRLREMKDAAARKALAHFGSTARHAESYAVGALDIAHTITMRMRRLDRVEYEGLLRPAFRQDEWKLIAVGALIGLLVGELQVLLLLS